MATVKVQDSHIDLLVGHPVTTVIIMLDIPHPLMTALTLGTTGIVMILAILKGKYL